MPSLRRFPLSCLITFLFLALTPTVGSALPAGFSDSIYANGLGSNATAMAFAPDGRLFVLQQSGAVRIVSGGVLLPTPFLNLTVDSAGERGLLGIAFDPAFATNRYLYLYYTATTPAVHNRVSRFTASATDRNIVEPGSELALLNLDNLSSATTRNGGGLRFGSDGKLYIGVGENANPSNAETLGNGLGKVHRINPDGSIPTDNPFRSTSGAVPSIWAYGFRNPFALAVQPGTGLIYVNDVGEDSYEEINKLNSGAFYGWPRQEGANTQSGLSYTAPVFSYPHSGADTAGCAITGGAFYNPTTSQFPPSYVGQYFFSDLCTGWVRSLSSGSLPVELGKGLSAPVGIEAGTDGALYVLERGSGQVRRIAYGAPQPVSLTPASGAGASQTFTFQFTDSRGWQDLGVVNVLINKFLDAKNACYLAYSRPDNVVYLANDAGDGLLPGIALNGAGSVSNSQCAISGAGSSAFGIGESLTLRLNLSFTENFGGERVFYVAARDTVQSNSGWQPLGAWRVPGKQSATSVKPSVTSLVPAHVTGATQTLTFTFNDPSGVSDFGIGNVVIHPFLDGRNSCYLAYSRPLNVLYLVADDGITLLQGITLGSGSLSNSQCTVTGTGSSAVAIGNDLILTLKLTMSNSYSGNKVIWAAARSIAEDTTGWQTVGTWSVP